jgi:hypothetical protein
MLAVFGNAWPDARNLSISFPADGVQIGTYENGINELLDGIAETQQWQELALRAYQTWAIHADINVGLRNDLNNAFGTPGMIVGDPRFGEFRIGAFPSKGLVGSSVPFQAVAGTYSGDLVLNSNAEFAFHDWSDNQGPDPAEVDQGQRDLFSLLLHETGNTLGLDDSKSDWTVMFGQYTVPKGVLTAEDIARVQALYGQRTDPYELVDNGQIQTASIVHTPVGFDPRTQVIRSRGSLLSADDVDYYKIVPLAGMDSVKIRVNSSGVSLLKSRLEILDSAGKNLAQTASLSVFESDNELTIGGLADRSEIYVRVSAADPGDVYSVGDYWLEADYRQADFSGVRERLGGYLTSTADQLYASSDLSNFSSISSRSRAVDLFDAERGVNDSVSTAAAIAPTPNLSTNSYQFQSSVSGRYDVDFFKITAPASIEGRLIVHLAGVGDDAADLRMKVVDSDGNPVGTSARLSSDGTFSIEVAQPQASRDYFIRVSVDPSSAVGVGDYVAVAEFETPSTQMHELVGGDLTEGVDRYVRWTAAKSKLFRFDLSATSDTPGQAVRLTVYDAHTREVKMVAVTQAGVTRSALAWLQQGEYILRFTALSDGTEAVTGANFMLLADGISDDQDEDPSNPFDDPYYAPYQYYDQTGPSSDLDPGSEYYDPYYTY